MDKETNIGTDYERSVLINSSPVQAFEVLSTKINLWWGDLDTPPKAKGDVFTVSWGEPWYQFKVVEYEPDNKITWECIDANQMIAGLEGVQKEWVGTRLIWHIEDAGEGSIRLSLKHAGLVPQFICFDFCSATWDRYITWNLKECLERPPD